MSRGGILIIGVGLGLKEYAALLTQVLEKEYGAPVICDLLREDVPVVPKAMPCPLIQLADLIIAGASPVPHKRDKAARRNYLRELRGKKQRP